MKFCICVNLQSWRILPAIFSHQKTEKSFRHETRGLEGVARFTSPHVLRHAVYAACARSARTAHRKLIRGENTKTHGLNRALIRARFTRFYAGRLFRPDRSNLRSIHRCWQSWQPPESWLTLAAMLLLQAMS